MLRSIRYGETRKVEIGIWGLDTNKILIRLSTKERDIKVCCYSPPPRLNTSGREEGRSTKKN